VTGPDRAAILLALGQIPLLLLVLLPGSLYLDDLRGQSYAAGRPWWPFVIESNGTHFAPLPLTIDWLTVRFAPLSDWPAVTFTVLIRVALVLAVWRLLREVFGPRSALLLPLALVAVTPALLPTTAWYRQAMTALLAVVFLCVAAHQHLRFVRTGRRRYLVGVALAVTAGLLTFEKAVLIAPWLLLLTAAAQPASASVRKRLRMIRRGWASLAVAGALTAAHLLIYLTGPFDKGAPGQLGAGEVVRMIGRQLGEGLVPGLLGGPWRWRETSSYYSVPDPPVTLIVVGLALTALALAWSLRRNSRRTVWALAAFLGYYLPAAGIVAAGRLTRFGDVVALDYRLWPDVTVVAVFCACLAVIPTRAEQSGKPRTARPRASQGVLLTLVAAVLIGTVVSTATFIERWRANPTGDYLRTLQAQLRDAGSRPVRLAPVGLPSAVLPFWIDPNYSVEDLLAATELATFHNIDGPVLVPDDAGRLVPLQLRQHATAAPGPSGFCGYGVRPTESRVIPLPAATPYYADEMVQLGVLASRATQLTVTVLSDSAERSVVTRSPLTTAAGPHRFLARVPFDTRVTAIRVRATDPRATVCVVLAALVSPEDLP
jgi:multisubunit Na+/H+ antiporter MnhC subunit